MGLMRAFEGKKGADLRVVEQHILAAIDKKEFPISKFSLTDLALGLFGQRGFEIIKDSTIPLARLREEVDPVNSTVFTNISNRIILDGVKDGFADPEFIGSKMVTEETSRRDGGRFGAIVPPYEEAKEIEEGGEYPDAKMGEDYWDLPYSKKVGQKIGITREAIAFDQTGDLIEAARRVGYNVGLAKELRTLRVVLGIWNPYSRKGVQAATFISSGPRANIVTSNDLVDYTDVETAVNKFVDMTDENTGRPIVVMPKQMLVAPHKVITARTIMNAIQVMRKSDSGNLETTFTNPIGDMEILSSQWALWVLQQATIDKYTGAAPGTAYTPLDAAHAKATWWVGDFKRAYRYRTIFPLAVEQATGTDAAFYRDIVAEFKAGERGIAWVYRPQYVVENQPA